MTQAEYLLSQKTTNPGVIRDTWVSLGCMKASNNTKVYFKDAIYLLELADANHPYNNSLIYVNEEYRAQDLESLIDWDQVTCTDEINGFVSFSDGVNVPNFTFLMFGDELQALEPAEPEKVLDFIPFTDYTSQQLSIDIPDDEYMIVMTQLGMPFIRPEELEYNKREIVNYFIKPMVDKYWKYFPFVEEQYLGNYAASQAFKIEMPKYAYNAIPYYTLGQGAAVGGGFGAGAFNYVRTEMMGGLGGFTGQFGRGLSYRKPVPGFSGLQSTDAALMSMQARQGYMNYFRREKFQKVKENGKLYITGFSTIGGALNVKWLESRPDWDLIDYEELDNVRQICTANVLMNFGILRSMIKSDLPGNIDFSLLMQRGEKLYEEINNQWKQSSTSYMHALCRGGL